MSGCLTVRQVAEQENISCDEVFSRLFSMELAGRREDLGRDYEWSVYPEEKPQHNSVYNGMWNWHLLYTMYSPRTNLIKIGRSKRPWLRRRELELSTGLSLSIIGVREYFFDDEPNAHKFYSKYRTTGEWFEAAPEVWAFARSLRDSRIKFL